MLTCSADAHQAVCMDTGIHYRGYCKWTCAYVGGCSRDLIHLGVLAVRVQPEEGRRAAFADMMKAHLQRSYTQYCTGLQVIKSLRVQTSFGLLKSGLVQVCDTEISL